MPAAVRRSITAKTPRRSSHACAFSAAAWHGLRVPSTAVFANVACCKSDARPLVFQPRRNEASVVRVQLRRESFGSHTRNDQQQHAPLSGQGRLTERAVEAHVAGHRTTLMVRELSTTTNRTRSSTTQTTPTVMHEDGCGGRMEA